MKFLVVVLLAVATSAVAQDIKCIPLSSFMLDCNTCYCTKRGEIDWCTLKNCAKYDGTIQYLNSLKVTRSDTEEFCKAGTSFKWYCNSCKCLLDGSSAACTKKACNMNVWNSDGTLKTMTKGVPNTTTKKA